MATTLGTGTIFVNGDARNFMGTIQDIERQAPGIGKRFGASMGGGIAAEFKNVLGGIAFGALVQQLGAATIKFTQMGQESAQLEARFRAFSGGAEVAARNLAMMNDAVGLALTRDDQMVALNGMLASGLVTTAQEAADLARAAIWLGDAQTTAAQRIDGLTNALLRGREAALIPYGVNMDQLKGRVKALTDANKDLTDSQATLQAFMEQAPEIMRRIKEEGGKATTVMQELDTTFKNFQDSLASVVAPTVVPVLKDATGMMTDLAAEMNGDFEAADAMLKALDAYSTAVSKLTTAQMQLTEAEATQNPYLIEAKQLALAMAEANLKQADSTATAWEAVVRSKAGVLDYANEMNAAAAASKKLADAQSNLRISAWTPLPLDPWATFKNQQTSGTTWGNEAPGAADFELVLKRMGDASSAAATRNEKAWNDAAAATQAAFEAAASAAEGAFTSAQGASVGLRDFRQGGALGANAPGQNGPFEAFYQLQAWLSDNSWGQTADKYGITSKAQGQGIVGAFQSGNWNEDVTKMIDKDKLIAEIKASQMGTEVKRTFAEEIARAAGVGTDVVSALVFGDANGAAAGAAKVAQGGVDMAGAVLTGFANKRPDMVTAAETAAQAMIDAWVNWMNANMPSAPTGGGGGGLTGPGGALTQGGGVNVY